MEVAIPYPILHKLYIIENLSFLLLVNNFIHDFPLTELLPPDPRIWW